VLSVAHILVVGTIDRSSNQIHLVICVQYQLGLAGNSTRKNQALLKILMILDAIPEKRKGEEIYFFCLKIERYNRTLKSDCFRTKFPLPLEEAKRVVKQIVSDYNDRRLRSAIGYITPSDMLAGKQKEIHEERDRKLEDAPEDRAKIRAQRTAARYSKSTRPIG